jgi:hypothetical protein
MSLIISLNRVPTYPRNQRYSENGKRTGTIRALFLQRLLFVICGTAGCARKGYGHLAALAVHRTFSHRRSWKSSRF